jgi:predicted small lipoprotein YifL
MPRKSPLFLTTFFILTSVLSACGQKGPLYLPQDAAAPQAPVAAASAETSEEEKEKSQTEQNHTDDRADKQIDESSVEPAVENE